MSSSAPRPDAAAAINLPNVEDLHAQGKAITAGARQYQILTREACDNAALFLRRVANFKDDVKRRFEESKRLANALHKSITKAENEELAPALEAEGIVKRALSDYQIDEERKRRVEQARLQQEQRERDEAARNAEAEHLDKSGDTEAALAILERPIAVVSVPLAMPKTDGVSYRSAWKFEVIDAARVAAAFLSPDPKKIQSVVDGMKAQASDVVGGIRVWEEKVPIVRR